MVKVTRLVNFNEGGIWVYLMLYYPEQFTLESSPAQSIVCFTQHQLKNKVRCLFKMSDHLG